MLQSINLGSILCVFVKSFKFFTATAFYFGKYSTNIKFTSTQVQGSLLAVKKLDLKLLCLGKALTGNPLHPAPMVVNRFFGGVNNVVLEKY